MATRLCIFSDVHGDVHALQQAFEAAERLGCTQFVCAGDVIDYGLFPDETIALLAQRRVPTVRGNHERWVLEGTGGPSPTRDLLSDGALEWIRGLPLEWSATIEGVHVVVTHARPGSDMKGIPSSIGVDAARDLLARAGAQVLIVGHTHESFVTLVEGAGMIVNPGALLRDPGPGAESPAAPGTFGVLELPSGRFDVVQASHGAAVTIMSSSRGFDVFM
jgi:predicted phosphodiesterase